MQGDFTLGDWLVQPSTGRAARNGETVYIRAKVMDLLVFLATRPGEVLSKDQILDGVWGTHALSESALTRSIRELRHALGDDAEKPVLVETIPKRGYRLIAPVQPAAATLTAHGPQTDKVLPSQPQAAASSPETSVGRRRWARWLGLCAAATIVLAALGWMTRIDRIWRAAATPPLVRFFMLPPQGTTFGAYPTDPLPAISPDGRHIATVARTPTATHQIWVHTLDSVVPQPLPGTDGGDAPFWSPDGRFVGFFAAGKLNTVPVSGGPRQTLCDAPESFGAAWSPGGVVLFAPSHASGLYQVPASGGEPVAVTRLDQTRGETSHRFPHFLPDGRRFIYLVRSRQPEHRGLFAGSLNSAERKRLTPAESNVIYVSGYLLFVRGTTLMAQPFDSERLELTGDAVPIADGVLPAPTVRFAPFAASGNVLTYRTGGVHQSKLTWMDREGRRLGSVGPHARYMTLALSPSSTALAVDVLDPRTQDVDTWVFDLKRNVSARVTSTPGLDGYPLWTADGKRLVFASNREDTWDLYQHDLDGGTTDRLLIESPSNKYPSGWSADGHSLLYVNQSDLTGNDLWLMPLVGTGKPVPLLQTSFNETQAQVSPDGRWLAYTSDESGRFEVYVRRFSSGGGKWRISTAGGCQPRWRGDSSELFYLHGGQVMAVTIEGNASLLPGIARPLFPTQVGRNSELTWDYVVTPDGQRFLMKELVFEEGGSPMLVVLNWQRLLAR